MRVHKKEKPSTLARGWLGISQLIGMKLVHAVLSNVLFLFVLVWIFDTVKSLS